MNKFENINSYFSFVPLYNDFIEKYMIKANSSFVVIYIFLLKCYINKEDIYLDKVSAKLNILASDIIKALDYWKSENIISYKQMQNKVEILFFPFKNDEINENNLKKSQNLNYKEDEITINSQKEDIQKIFRLAEKKFAKTLSYQDREILISLYENYGMSIEILAVLFTYCIENGKTNLKYIEKVAIDWCENNIDSIEKVEAYLKVYNNDFKTIMGFFGQSNRTPIKKEEDIMKIWLIDYKMPMKLIEEACTRTVLKTGKVSFEYANSILKDWKDKNITSLEEVKRLDSDYENSLKAKEEEKQKKLEQIYKNKISSNNNFNNYKTNKFVNYKQKEPDYELLKKIQLKALREEVGSND
ncbi:DnaD domain protein [[Clostridium] colinum]|uniref:DnaD domain protein n=1 Tax=[Clostridium] colinum TaxID=36835 RepID=UPI0020249977|nr:DnaD domain protein [[Clostridium] colinum]